MSKGSKMRRRLLQQLKQNKGDQHKQPIVGSMAERMTQIAKEERGEYSHAGEPKSFQSSMSWERTVYGDGHQHRGMTGYLPRGSYFNGREWIYPGNSQLNSELNKVETVETDAGYRPLQEDTFRCESDDITKECPIAKVPEIDIPAPLWRELLGLTKDYNDEWLAYMIGTYDSQKNKFSISKVYFPPQTATSGHVDVDDDFEPHAGTIGAIHSHVGMEVFFSQEDINHSNWQIEIVINRREEYKAMVRHKLECGKYAKSYSKVWLLGNVSSNAYKGALDAAFNRGKRLQDEKWKKQSQQSQQSQPQPQQSHQPIGYFGRQSVTANTNSPAKEEVQQSAISPTISPAVDTITQLEKDLAIDASIPLCDECGGRGWVVDEACGGRVCDKCQGMGDAPHNEGRLEEAD